MNHGEAAGEASGSPGALGGLPPCADRPQLRTVFWPSTAARWGRYCLQGDTLESVEVIEHAPTNDALWAATRLFSLGHDNTVDRREWRQIIAWEHAALGRSTGGMDNFDNYPEPDDSREVPLIVLDTVGADASQVSSTSCVVDIWPHLWFTTTDVETGDDFLCVYGRPPVPTVIRIASALIPG